MVLSNRLMFSLVQHGDAGARERHDLVADQMDVELLGAVRLQILEGEERQARSAGDAAQRGLGMRSTGNAAMNCVSSNSSRFIVKHYCQVGTQCSHTVVV